MNTWYYLIAGGGLFVLALLLLWISGNKPSFIPDFPSNIMRAAKRQSLDTFLQKPRKKVVKAELQEDHRERALQEGYTPPEMKRAVKTGNLIPIRFESDTFRYKPKYKGDRLKKPYVSLIAGTDPKWGLKREFLKIKKVKTGYDSAKYSSILETELQEGTILEARNAYITEGGFRGDYRGFWLVMNGAGKYTEGMKKHMLRIGNPSDPESINEIKELLHLSPKERIARAKKEGKLQMECWEHGRRTGDIYGGFSTFEMIEVGSGELTKHGAYLLEQEKATKDKIAKLRKDDKLTPGRELRLSRRRERHDEEMKIRKHGSD